MPLLPLLTLTALLSTQDLPRGGHVCPTEPPPQGRIDEAVEKGVAFLSAALKRHPGEVGDFSGRNTLDTLVLAAMVYGGLPEDHPDVQLLLKRVLDRRPTSTYETVLLEVALDKLDREFYQWKILE